jgi:2-keto-3-deoxy-L-rhamnonate aldolase RhmA
MTQTFKQRLQKNEFMIGTLISMNQPAVAEIMIKAGYDWLFIDAEHGAFDPADTQSLLQAAGDTPCLIRVPHSEGVWIKKALDIGAAGIIVPQVNSAAEAEAVVQAAKYPPRGQRGVGLGRAHGFGFDFQHYMANANEETTVIIQAESSAAIEDIEAICAVPGVDCIFIGPNDLSASLGHFGEFDHPDVQSAMDRVQQAAQSAGIALGYFGVTPESVQPAIDKGYSLIAVGVDVLFLGQAAAATVATLRDKN